MMALPLGEPNHAPSPSLSTKAMGKRPEKTLSPPSESDAVTDIAMTEATALPPPSVQSLQTRQKRIMPSRSRRGGPGVGSCDVDIMILDNQKRKLDSEPLISPSTMFLLTTDSSLVPSSSSSSSSFHFNTHANERYFDRPEVLEAYKEQLAIETPEFVKLSDAASVGGRFRPRQGDEEFVDTSDAAYEKRHRKYETFEKRQRLREKEKLKHEQYKLKERIEQLRAMDTPAFLALPASSFSEPQDFSVSALEELPGAHVNGAAVHNEGERRRREMLDMAVALEERYAVLLPPERKWLEKEKRNGKGASMSVEPEDDTADESEAEPVDGELIEVMKQNKATSIKLKLKLPPRAENLESLSKSGLSPLKTRKASLLGTPSVSQTSSPQALPLEALSPHTTAPRPHSPSSGDAVSPEHAPLLQESASAPPSQKRRVNHLRASDGTFMKHPKQGVPLFKMRRQDGEHPLGAESNIFHPTTVSATQYASASAAHGGTPGRPDRIRSVLLMSAIRNAGPPMARKTQRHVTAFGVKVPPEVDEMREFQIPEWALDKEDRERSEEVTGGEEEVDELEEVINDQAGHEPVENGQDLEEEGEAVQPVLMEVDKDESNYPDPPILTNPVSAEFLNSETNEDTGPT